MDKIALSEFADKVAQTWPVVIKEFMRSQTTAFHKIKITMPQCIVLEFLSHGDESKMTDIAKFINVSTAALTQVVERLVRDGYVVRAKDPNDRRIIRIKLTAKGTRTITDIVNKRKEMVMKMFSVISTEEREQYLRILEHIRHHLKKE